MKSTTTTPPTTTARELATREVDGLQVSLLWDAHSGDVTVAIDDRRLGTRSLASVPADRALHAFEHPFTYMEPAAPSDVDDPAAVEA
jgi:hypothetical protein